MTTINPNSFQAYIRTTEDATNFLSILGTLNNEVFKKNTTLDEILEQDVSYQKGLTIKKIAATHKVDLQNRAEVPAFITKLTESINELPTVHLTLAFAPRRQLITVMSQWFMVNFQQVVLLDIKVDKSIMGGSIVEFNGKRQDYSLRKQVEDIPNEKN